MKLRRIVNILFFVLVLYVFVNSSRLFILTQRTPSNIDGREFATIVVTGQGVRNGTLIPDDRRRDMLARLDLAIELFDQQEEKPNIILSGYGRGYRVRDLHNQEAYVMYQYLAPKLREKGYNPHQYLILENQSRHSIENALYVKELQPKQPLLILAPVLANLRNDLVFSTILNDYDLTIYSIHAQTSREKAVEWLRTAGTFFVLLLPGDTPKRAAAKWAYVQFADESCRREGYLLQKVICGTR